MLTEPQVSSPGVTASLWLNEQKLPTITLQILVKILPRIVEVLVKAKVTQHVKLDVQKAHGCDGQVFRYFWLYKSMLIE